MNCPICEAVIVMHTAGEKAGRGHCNVCGICWEPADLKPKKKVTRGAGN